MSCSTTSAVQAADFYACWPLVQEAAVAISMAKSHSGEAVVLHHKPKSFDDDLLQKFAEKSVVLFGSYYEVETVEQLLKVAKSVTVYVFSEKDLENYGELPETLQVSVLKPTGDWENDLLHLTRVNTADETEQDQFFYRGMLFKYPGNIEESIRGWLAASEQEGDSLGSSLVATGKVIVEYNEYLAKQVVELNSVEVLVGREDGKKYRARLVVSGPILVMPVVKCAAQYAAQYAAEGYDLGINMRPTADGKTRFTFYTTNPDVDLSFVSSAPFNGGGSPSCKGCGTGQVDLSKLDAEKWLESAIL